MCKLAVNFEICEEKFTLVIVNFKSRMEDVRYVEFAVKAVFPLYKKIFLIQLLFIYKVFFKRRILN